MGYLAHIGGWFAQLHPEFLLASVLGAALLYSRWGKDAIGIYVPRDFIRTFEIQDSKITQIEFVIFILVGGIVSVWLAGPSNMRQAFTAGLGWTGLLTVPKPARKGK